MKRRFTIKELAITTAFVGIGLGWGLDRYRLNREIEQLEELLTNEEIAEYLTAEYDAAYAAEMDKYETEMNSQ